MQHGSEDATPPYHPFPSFARQTAIKLGRKTWPDVFVVDSSCLLNELTRVNYPENYQVNYPVNYPENYPKNYLQNYPVNYPVNYLGNYTVN